jgi:predicted peroxiredoxin
MARKRTGGAFRSTSGRRERPKRDRILLKSAWGSDDPTKASFAFLHANAFADAGHEVQIFLLGEAVSLMRDPVANAVVPVGWPPLATSLAATVAHGIRIHV